MVSAQTIIFATHYPIVNFPGMYFLRQHQEPGYVLALAGCGCLNGMYYSADADGLSFRSAGDILLLGEIPTGPAGMCGAAPMPALKGLPGNIIRTVRWSAVGQPRTACPMMGFRLWEGIPV